MSTIVVVPAPTQPCGLPNALPVEYVELAPLRVTGKVAVVGLGTPAVDIVTNATLTPFTELAAMISVPSEVW